MYSQPVSFKLHAQFFVMAPGPISVVADSSDIERTQKPTVYLLDSFHPTATTHAQTLFDAVLPNDPRHSQWREKAEYLLIRGSYLTAEDVDSCPNLKALGKQGVGMYLFGVSSVPQSY
jgi:hypothetical protein